MQILVLFHCLAPVLTLALATVSLNAAPPVVLPTGGEIKLPIAAADVDKVAHALGLKKDADEQRTIFIFELPDNALSKNSDGPIILRARQEDGKKADVTVKLRRREPMSAEVLKKWVADDKHFKAETEWLVGKGAGYSYSLEKKIDGVTLKGHPPDAEKLFKDDDLREFFETTTGMKLHPKQLHASVEIESSAWKIASSVGRDASAEQWTFAGRHIFELSCKVDDVSAIEKTAKQFEEAFTGDGKELHVDAHPESKTQEVFDAAGKDKGK